MAFEKTVPAEQNPISDAPATLYIRDALYEIDNHSLYARTSARAWSNRAAFDAGKSEISPAPGVSFGPQPTNDVFSSTDGRVMAPAKPSWPEIRAIFAAEFDYIDAIWHELSARYDPYLADAVPVDPMPDPATTDEIQAKLDAAGFTGLSK